MSEFWKTAAESTSGNLTREKADELVSAMKAQVGRPPELPFIVVPRWVKEAAGGAMNSELRGLMNIYGQITGIEQTLERNRKPHIYKRDYFWHVSHSDSFVSAYQTFALACRGAYLSSVFGYHGHIPPIFEPHPEGDRHA